MKIRILDRILVALAGLLMLAVAAALAAQLFFQQDVVGWVGSVLSDPSLRAILIAIGVVLILLGFYCLLMLFRRRGKDGKFITQKTESGELSISLKALESMVTKCLEPHKEIAVQGVHLENVKGSLLIRIRGTVAGGVSIPLTVDMLQQQIKQYVTACSGVEVKEIRVLIESSGEEAKDAPFAIAAPAAPALLKGVEEAAAEGETTAADTVAAPAAVTATAAGAYMSEETIPEADIPTPVPEPEKPTVEDTAAAAAAAAAALMEEIPPEEDDRPVHQRLFSMQEEPCVMPMPPTPKEAEEDAKAEEAAKAGEAAKAREDKAEEAPEAGEASKAEEDPKADEPPKAEEAPKAENVNTEEVSKSEEPKAEEGKPEETEAKEASKVEENASPADNAGEEKGEEIKKETKPEDPRKNRFANRIKSKRKNPAESQP